MDPGTAQLVLYIVAKFIAYALWCGLGIQLLWRSELDGQAVGAGATSNPDRRKWLSAAGYGLLRLAMGMFFGVVIWIVGTMVAQNLWKTPGRDVMTYLLVYVPVRFMEWTILAWIIARNSSQKIGYGWRFGGIAISCLADIPLIAAAGWMLPIGRFFC